MHLNAFVTVRVAAERLYKNLCLITLSTIGQ